MHAYSLDLRERIVAAAQQGHSLRTIAQRFAVSAASVSRYVNQHKRQQNLLPKPLPGAKPRLDALTLSALLDHLEQNPDQTVTELHHWLLREHPGVRVSRATVHRALVRAGLTHKKRHWSLPNAMKQSELPGEKR